MAKPKFEKDLVHNLVQIQNDKNMKNFLDVLLTDSEVEDLSHRLQIFKGLLAGKSQRDISEELDVAIGTVIRGAAELRRKKDKVKRMIQL
ncbi:MAG: transcriptional regulator [Candidatus Magasanikbacteria bacterium]|mgnify:CR=1 FL=1|jgi:Trp operon repressor|nr:transcriptional regulator [Candidatus Magasanikbacteria bacterium]MBT4315126.1 transcriptional regulator [Candidatus Magasanikbacteria bacterium]MBT4547418.1 transcriptional regulator [Candidatus Magasanikbacteria bacterium]MBT6819341.1 transcriptional regulator [Candidatus Magasanikbacteria bacterium]